MAPSPAASERASILAVIAVLVAVGAALLTALTARQLSGDQSRIDTREEALAAGRQIAVDFAAYDYRHIAEDFKRVADESTGEFHKQYLTQSTGVHDLIVKAKSVSTAEVAGAGVVSSDPDKATVVVALNRTVSNTSLDQPQQDSFGLQIVLVLKGERWLASEVTPL
jgi:Mce-associated membrane protein